MATDSTLIDSATLERLCARAEADERDRRDRLTAVGASPAELDAILRRTDLPPIRDAAELLALHREWAELEQLEARRNLRSALARNGVPEIHLAHVLDRAAVVTEPIVAARQWASSCSKPFLVLLGTVGTGKSGGATEALVQLSGARVHGRAVAGSWCAASSLAAIAGLNAECQRAWSRLERAPALVIDDIGSEHRDANGWATGAISKLVASRYDSLSPTILTGNLAPSDLVAAYGVRFSDRLHEVATIVICKGASIRRSSP